MSKDTDPKRRHSILALSLVGLVAGMVGLSFASVPLYRVFCQVTGYGGVPQRAEKLLRTIEARAKDPGAFINLDPARDFPLVDSLGEDAIYYYAEYWESVGCVEMAQNQAISDTTMRLRLTVDGWGRLDSSCA
jgi:hypothetical protein